MASVISHRLSHTWTMVLMIKDLRSKWFSVQCLTYRWIHQFVRAGTVPSHKNLQVFTWKTVLFLPGPLLSCSYIFNKAATVDICRYSCHLGRWFEVTEQWRGLRNFHLWACQVLVCCSARNELWKGLFHLNSMLDGSAVRHGNQVICCFCHLFTHAFGIVN